MKKFLSAFTLFILTAAMAQAVTADAPIDVDADQLEVLRDKGMATFSGNVRVIQGDMRLTSQTLTLRYNEAQKDNDLGGVTEIRAKGKVTIVFGDDTATGNEAVYDVPGKKVRLQGNVTLVREENVLRGETLVFDLVTGDAALTAAPRERVKARFAPTPKEEAKP